MFLCPDNSFWKRKCTLHFSTEKVKSDFQLPLKHWKKFLLLRNQMYWPKQTYALDLRYQTHIWIIPSEINRAPTLKPALVTLSTGGKSGPQDQKQQCLETLGRHLMCVHYKLTHCPVPNTGLLTMMVISLLQTLRSGTLFTHILFSAQRVPLGVRTRNTVENPPGEQKCKKKKQFEFPLVNILTS